MYTYDNMMGGSMADSDDESEMNNHNNMKKTRKKTPSPNKKSPTKKKKPIPEFFKRKEEARLAGKNSFVYNNKTYYKMTVKSGMVTYTSNKSKAD